MCCYRALFSFLIFLSCVLRPWRLCVTGYFQRVFCKINHTKIKKCEDSGGICHLNFLIFSIHCNSLIYFTTCCTDFCLCLWGQVTGSQQKKQLSITFWFHLSLRVGGVNWNRKQDGLLRKTGEICPTELRYRGSHKLSRKAFRLFAQVSPNYKLLIKCLTGDVALGSKLITHRGNWSQWKLCLQPEKC